MFVGPAKSIDGLPFAQHFVDALKLAKLPSGRDYLVPIPLRGGRFGSCAIESKDVSTSLKLILCHIGVEEDVVRRATSHCCKKAILCMAGKCGIDFESRLILGYHKDSTKKTMRAYAPVDFIKPLLQLDDCMDAIHDKRFDPDTGFGVFTDLIERPVVKPKNALRVDRPIVPAAAATSSPLVPLSSPRTSSRYATARSTVFSPSRLTVRAQQACRCPPSSFGLSR